MKITRYDKTFYNDGMARFTWRDNNSNCNTHLITVLKSIKQDLIKLKGKLEQSTNYSCRVDTLFIIIDTSRKVERV